MTSWYAERLRSASSAVALGVVERLRLLLEVVEQREELLLPGHGGTVPRRDPRRAGAPAGVTAARPPVEDALTDLTNRLLLESNGSKRKDPA